MVMTLFFSYTKLIILWAAWINLKTADPFPNGAKIFLLSPWKIWQQQPMSLQKPRRFRS